ncbi:cation/multidrug efflux membrane fusion protein, AcrA family [Psychroflexus torquis ATCC 700755]|uniref:Cation/multidrug efflux membrane fusion protein, AcrA family n=1 Tax=Psychroflexus torquis (strain ATCC 700755 / CIP 106069 / ACAM 623) TaxID=313595 RepID=K4IDI7_PSYTT|nr:HlyD family efflux transporter periplasmic adaptor subunit [Psychroflexus torquis]AFU67938.1 cation/multidrug efflux membrane fusion protein, AcrA family [Psychroflexus torquis ATCC 700755]
MRKIILFVLGVVLLVGAIFGAKFIIDSKEPPETKIRKTVKTVFVETVHNSTVPILIPANGNLIAKHRVELYAEVQGVFKFSAKPFRAGQRYKKGQVLIKMDALEYRASVQSAKSDLYNQITAIMPDLRLDFPEVHPKWLNYLNRFNIDKAVLPLPESKTDKERFFIYGRGINTAYYNVKNLEERLVKYKITAPFNGVLIEALVTEGTLIRSGQKLGEYIDPEVYELQVAIAKEYADLLQEGESVSLSNNKKTQSYTGTVSRINASIEQSTQTVSVFIEVRGSSLKEGMYLKADIEAKKVENAIALDRSLVNDSDEMFVVKDTILSTIKVQPIYFSDKHVVVKGIPDGEVILAKQISGAYKGMLVKVVGDSLSKSESNTSLEAVNQ